MSTDLSRRALLGTGLAITISLRARAEEQGGTPPPATPAPLPGSLKETPFLDAWIRVAPDGAITAFTGKAELGQGLRTALLQVVAEELEVDPATIRLVTADTALTPNEGFTAGSHSMQDSGTALLNAAAQVRELLRAGATVDLHVQARPDSRLGDPRKFRLIGTPMQRVDIPPKVTGAPAYVQDLRLEGMLHARVVRQPSPGATLRSLDTATVEKMRDVVAVHVAGGWLAVVATREWSAIKASRALAAAARWDETARFPDELGLIETIRALPAREIPILTWQAPTEPGTKKLRARYSRPYVMHAAIGPSCAVARMDDAMLTVWTHTQGVFPLRAALASLLRIPPEQVRCIHTEGSGCYGHNGADDVAGDAALLARRHPGRPIRVQWMREDEHTNEPYGAAMLAEVAGEIDAQGRIVDWDYGVWSNTHNRRPTLGGLMLQNAALPDKLPVPPPAPIPMPEGGGERNSNPIYRFPNARVVSHFIAEMPLRVSALRSLGAYLNVFAIESFMDELAEAAGTDPVAFRLAHLEDARGRAVIQLAAERFGWDQPRGRVAGAGRGFAFARYKNLGAYCAVALDLRVDHETGRVALGRVVAAVDSGQPINPDGIRNQIEGAIIQSASWTLYEAVRFDRARITSTDWSGYPILRFPALPAPVEVHIVPRPGDPFLGTGEAGQGPTSAAIANAIRDATGARLRDLPLAAAKLKAAIGV